MEKAQCVESLVEVLQSVIQEHDVSGIWGFEWSTGCDRPRVGTFGGGAVMFTKDTAHWMNSAQWLELKLRESH